MRFILSLSLLACGETPNPDLQSSRNQTQTVSPNVVRDVQSESNDFPTETATDLGPAEPPSPSILQASWHPYDSNTAEDGQRMRVPSENPIAIDIESPGWKGRALDPVLYIDERRFYQYTHPGPGLIRYVIADVSWVLEATQWAFNTGTMTRVGRPFHCPFGKPNENSPPHCRHGLHPRHRRRLSNRDGMRSVHCPRMRGPVDACIHCRTHNL